MNEEIKIGSIVKDRITHQYCIIISKYKNSNFDWEVFSLQREFMYGKVRQDCRLESDLSLRSYEEYVKSLITDSIMREIIKKYSFITKIKLLFRRYNK